LEFIRPGKPMDNRLIESFNGRLRNECLNVEVFFSIPDAQAKLERWRMDYNQQRPHRSLRDQTPQAFALASEGKERGGTHVSNRFVFFRESAGGPFGSLNVPVLPYCTIATDKEVYPRACLAFVETIVPRKQGDRVVNARFNQFVLDQDTGGAIRAAGRCDIFVGVGLGAEALAGRTGAEGKLFYLFCLWFHLYYIFTMEYYSAIERNKLSHL